MKITKNKGMYLESVLKNSIEYYEMHKIALIRKQTVPIKITKVTHKEVMGTLTNKCDVDYYGIYEGRFVAIEAKQTKEIFFNKSNILEHQMQFLKQIKDFKGLAYLIIYFQSNQHFYLIDYEIFEKKILSKKKSNRIKETWFQDNCHYLDLIYPGRLDFIKFIKHKK